MTLLFHFPGARLANVHVGLTDVVPRNHQMMSLSAFKLRECGLYSGPVPIGTTVTIPCPDGGVHGRYLVVQLDGTDYLTLCEVTAAEAVGKLDIRKNIVRHTANVKT